MTAPERPDLPLSPHALNQRVNPDQIIESDDQKLEKEMERLAELSMDAPSDSDEAGASGDLYGSNADLRLDELMGSGGLDGRHRKKKKKKSKRDRMLEKAYKPKPRFSMAGD